MYQKERIELRLKEIASEHGVDILFAIESGSRAWGFESKDSDYDVRFIYRHPRNWYLNVLPKRDVIEYPIVDEFDYSGWDLRKALFLMNKSNPVLFEWLRSPIVYVKNESFYKAFRSLGDAHFSPLSAIYHYLHMAKRNYKEFLQNETVKAKKYFYVLRPIFACDWILRYEEFPPLEFEILLDRVTETGELRDSILQLLEAKRAGNELDARPRIGVINDYLEAKIAAFDVHVGDFNFREKPAAERLDQFLVDWAGG